VPVTDMSSQERIRESTLKVINEHGIVGLRIADVASGAGVSVALIYKYFGDRDGLLAEVLGAELERHYNEDIATIEAAIESGGTDKLDLDAFVAALPHPEDAWRRERRWLRVEALAASRTIPSLTVRIGQSVDRVAASMTRLAEKIRVRTGNDSPTTARIMAWLGMALGMGFVLNDVMSGQITNAEFDALMKRIWNQEIF
jgi:AcrR family transcriptional regulator